MRRRETRVGPARPCRLGSALARLAPRSTAGAWGPGLAATLEERLAAARRRGALPWAVCAAREAVDLLRLARAERRGRPTRPGARVRREQMVHDLMTAARRLRRQPVFTVVAVLTLALGIGANAAMFSVVDAVLVRPLPYSGSDDLVRIRFGESGPDMGSMEVSLPDLLDWRAEASQLAGLAAYASTAGGTVVDFGEDAEVVPSGLVTGNLFGVLGVPPLMGRAFETEDDVAGAAPVVLIGEGLWRSRFGASPDVLGRLLRLSGEEHTVVGVLPADVDYPVGARLWLPVGRAVPPQLTENRQVAFLNVVARLAPGATLASAAAELAGIVERVTHPKHPDGRRGEAFFSPLREELVGDVRTPLLVLMAASLAVLGIACANVANLQIVRGLSRRREFAVRGALGAGIARLARLSLAESGLLAALGVLAGLGLAQAGLEVLLAMSPVRLFRGETIGLNATVVAFAATLGALTALVFGALPVWHGTRAKLADTLRQGARIAGGAGRVQGAFVVVQVGLALVLMIGAGLLARSFAEMLRVDTGFDRERALMLDVALLPDTYQDAEARHRFFETLVERVAALPGAEAAGAVLARPFRGPNGFDAEFTIRGRTPEEQAAAPFLNYEAATVGYFEAAGIPLLAGRGLSDSDTADAPPVVVVSRAVADRFWPEGGAVGARIKWGGPESPSPWMEVVGVVGSARYRGVERVSLDAYVPARQSQWPLRTLVVKGARPEQLLAGVRTELRRLEPRARAVDAATTERLIADSLQGPRFSTALLGLFGVLALAIGAVGLYGVLAFDLALRTRELGVRTALGATPGALLGLTLGRGLRLAGAGAAVGLVAAAALSRVAADQLYGVTARDPSTFATAPLLLLAVAALASLFPAWRASRVDPLAALRED